MTGTAADAAESDGADEDDAADSRVARTISIGTSAAVLFLLLRVLVVADWDWNTAAAIMAVTDINSALTMFFGTLMADAAVTGALVVLLLPLTFLRLVWPISGTRPGVVDAGLMLLVLIAATLSLSDTFQYFWVPIGAAALGLAFVAMRLFWRHGRLQRFTHFVFRKTPVIAGIGFMVLAAVVTIPWVPLEDVVTKSGTVHGYVLAAEPGFLTVLTEPDREVRVLTTSEVLERR